METMENRWTGWAAAAGILMIVTGAFRAISGIIGLFNSDWIVRGFSGYYFVDVTGVALWSLIIGVLLIIGGIAVFSGRLWARILAMVFVGVSIVSEFLWLPIYPLWSILTIALYLLILIGLVMETRAARAEELEEEHGHGPLHTY